MYIFKSGWRVRLDLCFDTRLLLLPGIKGIRLKNILPFKNPPPPIVGGFLIGGVFLSKEKRRRRKCLGCFRSVAPQANFFFGVFI